MIRKELDAVPMAIDLVQVLLEHRDIEGIVSEASTHEERTPSPQQAAHDWQVQVISRGDVGNHVALVVEEVAEQQIV